MYRALVKAQELRAANHLATHLVATNRDFNHWSVSELTMHIADKGNPVYLDKKPAQKEA
jgi:hypothetical protein